MTDVLTYADHVDEVSSRRAVPVDVEELTVGVPDRDEPILGPIDLHSHGPLDYEDVRRPDAAPRHRRDPRHQSRAVAA